MVAEAESLVRANPKALEVGLFNLPCCRFTDTGLELDDDVEFEQWLDIGKILCRASRAVQWWIGDWLAYGEHKYGEKYAQGEVITGIDPQTLKSYNFVAANVQKLRRRNFLSWSHHREVAALPPASQDDLLKQAEENKWSKLQLRHHINAKKIEETDYPELETPIRRDYARIKAQFLEARKGMDAFVLEFTQFAEYWESLVGDVLWDLANSHESAEAWVLRKVESGCSKAREIMAETKLSKETVEGALFRLAEKKEIEKVKQGAATDEQRGAREDLYVPVKQSHDDIYEGRSSGSAMPDWDAG